MITHMSQKSEAWEQRAKKHLEQTKIKLGDKYFLASEERFAICKKAASEIPFMYVRMNMFDHTQCQKLNEILKKNSAQLSILNITNIADYSTEPVLLAKSVSDLIKDSKPIMILSFMSGPFYLLTSFQTTQAEDFLEKIRHIKDKQLKPESKNNNEEENAKAIIAAIKQEILTIVWPIRKGKLFGSTITTEDKKTKVVPDSVFLQWKEILAAEKDQKSYANALKQIKTFGETAAKKKKKWRNKNITQSFYDAFTNEEAFNKRFKKS